MAKSSKRVKKYEKIDLSNLSKKDLDHLTLGPKEVMKKYKADKQVVYARRFQLNKKIEAAGLTVDQLTGGTAPAPKAKPATKRGRPKKIKTVKPEPQKVEMHVEEVPTESREIMVVNKPVPVIMKPIEINFDNFTVRLNGVPKKISVNPDTNAIEIDL